MNRLVALSFLVAAPAVTLADAVGNDLPEPSLFGLFAAGVIGAGVAKWMGKNRKN